MKWRVNKIDKYVVSMIYDLKRICSPRLRSGNDKLDVERSRDDGFLEFTWRRENYHARLT
jgi:hypothetical protein